MTVDAPVPGTVLRGKYRVERVLGSGGMGVVLAATHLRLGGLVAIKMLRPEARGREEIVRRFAREARAASRLRGEHAVRVLDVDDSEAGDPFLVMEHLEGRDLQRALGEDGALAPATAAEYLLQACEGIAEAHASGIVHRDLKPANLFVAKRPDQSPLLKILDFGISKAAERDEIGSHDAIITRAHIAIGSPSYMSPEHLKNAADVDARADIWSLGVVLYQLLANGLPFEADTTAAIVARIAADPPAPLRARCPDVSEELEAVVMKCLAKDPSARYASVAELARALSSFGLRGESSAERVARVLDAGPPASTSLPVPPAPPAPAPQAGAGTASVVAAVGSPLAQAMGTEYGSSLGTTPPAEEPKRGSRLLRGAVLAGGVALVGAILVLSRGPSPSPAAAPPPATPAPLPSVAATNEPAPAPSAPASETPPPPKAPRLMMPRPKAAPSASASSPAPAPKNPLNIDFR